MPQDPASIVALNHIRVPVSATVVLARWHVPARSRGQSAAQGHDASFSEEGGCAAIDRVLRQTGSSRRQHVRPRQAFGQHGMFWTFDASDTRELPHHRPIRSSEEHQKKCSVALDLVRLSVCVGQREHSRATDSSILAVGLVGETTSTRVHTFVVGWRMSAEANGRGQGRGNEGLVVDGHCGSLPSKEGQSANAGAELH